MGNVRRLKIGILTSSRADYGIYLPLLKRLQPDPNFHLSILAFGTHLSEKFGYTAKQIESDGFTVDYKLDTLSSSDSPKDISLSMARTIEKFSEIWVENQFDLVFALGDRYEMFAAVASTIPFNIKVAHIHGGETTLGAIDNSFRHSISSMSKYHFVTTEEYFKRVEGIIGSSKNIYNVGALSIDSLIQTNFLSPDEFNSKFNIDLQKPTILITFHPETLKFEANKGYINELVDALKELSNYQQVVTMPNADTMGLLVREKLLDYALNKENVFCVESFGSQGYHSCMKHCVLMLGNSSSGFVEAAYFGKPVINIGNRQRGRIETPNIITVPITKYDILNAVKKALTLNVNIKTCQIYGNGQAAEQINQILIKHFEAND